MSSRRRTVVLRVEVDVNDNLGGNTNSNPASSLDEPIRYLAALDENNDVLHVERLPGSLIDRLSSLNRAKLSSPLASREQTSPSGSGHAENQSTRGIAERVKGPDRRPSSASQQYLGTATEEKFEIEEILDQREKDGAFELLVKWNGYPEPEWNSRSLMSVDAPESVREFDAAQRERARIDNLGGLEGLTQNLDIDPVAEDPSYAPSDSSLAEEDEVDNSDEDDLPLPTRRGTYGESVSDSPPATYEDALEVADDASSVTGRLTLFPARPLSPAVDSLFGTPMPTPTPVFHRPMPNRETPGLFMTPGPAVGASEQATNNAHTSTPVIPDNLTPRMFQDKIEFERRHRVLPPSDKKRKLTESRRGSAKKIKEPFILRRRRSEDPNKGFKDLQRMGMQGPRDLD